MSIVGGTVGGIGRACVAVAVGALLGLDASTAAASGDPGATVVSRYYGLRLSLGANISVPSLGPSADGCPVPTYFDEAERGFLHRLGPYVPAITKVVEGARRRLPIVAYNRGLPALREWPSTSADATKELAAARAWLAGAPGRTVVVTGRAKIPGGVFGQELLSLSVAVSTLVDRASLDALVAEVARAIGPPPARSEPPREVEAEVIGDGTIRIGTVGLGKRRKAPRPRPVKTTPLSECPKPAPLPATLVALERLTVARPGLEVLVNARASAVDALHAPWLAEETLAFARRIEDAFVAEVRSRAAQLGGLPADWPATAAPPPARPPRPARDARRGNVRPPDPPGLYVTIATGAGASFYVPLPRHAPEAISNEIHQKLYSLVAGLELPPAP